MRLGVAIFMWIGVVTPVVSFVVTSRFFGGVVTTSSLNAVEKDPYADLLANYAKNTAGQAPAVPDPTTTTTTSAITSTSETATTAAGAAAATTEKAPSLYDFIQTNPITPPSDLLKSAKSNLGSLSTNLPASSLQAPKTSTFVPAEGKAPTLLQYLQSNNGAASSGEAFDRIANAQEKLGILKSNLFNEVEQLKSFPSELSQQTANLEKLTTTIPTTTSSSDNTFLLQLTSWTAATLEALSKFDSTGLVEKLDWEDNAAWYLLGAAVLWGAAQRQAGRKSAESEYAEKLTAAEEQLASTRAAMEEAEATTAEIAKTTVQTARVDGNLANEALLKSMKMEAVEIEKTKMKKDIERLNQEKLKLEKLLEEARSAAPEPVVAVQEPEPVPEPVTEESAPVNGVVNGDAEQVKKAVSKGPKGTKAAKKSAPATAKGTPSAKKAVKKVKKVKKAKAAAKVAVAVEEEAGAVETAPAPESSENPWASLSKSSLERKTVKELTAYLQERGVSTSGKKKPDLLAAVREL